MIGECPFAIAPECVEAIALAVKEHGTQGVETGLYLLAAVDDPVNASVVAVAGDQGVERHPLLLEISAAANNKLFTWAVDQRLTIVAYVHSHQGGAFLSRTDSEEAFNVEGFVAVVVPHFKDPSAELSTWGWWQYTRGAWVRKLAARRIVRGDPARTVVFDEAGVRES